MTILTALPGMDVSIRVNDQPLTEHIDREATPANEDTTLRHIIKYIEVPSAPIDETGNHATFTIDANLDALPATAFLGTALEWHFFVDGREADGVVVTRSMITSHFQGRTCLSRGAHSGARVQPYTFRKLSIATNGEAGHKLDDIERSGLGNIRIEVHHVDMEDVQHGASHLMDAAAMKTCSRIDEKDMKGRQIGYSVGFAAAEEDRHWTNANTKYLDETLTPAAVYEFRYRSLDGLKAEGILPRTPSPTPEPDEDLAGIERQRVEAVRRAELAAMTKEDLIEDRLRRDMEDRATDNTNIKKEHRRDSPSEPRRRARRTPGGKKETLVIDDDGENFTSVLEDVAVNRGYLQPTVVDDDDEESVFTG